MTEIALRHGWLGRVGKRGYVKCVYNSFLPLAIAHRVEMSAANFAPYQPPPDDRQKNLADSVVSSSQAKAPSSRAAPHVPHVDQEKVPSSASRYSVDSDYDPRYATESYQS